MATVISKEEFDAYPSSVIDRAWAGEEIVVEQQGAPKLRWCLWSSRLSGHGKAARLGRLEMKRRRKLCVPCLATLGAGSGMKTIDLLLDTHALFWLATNLERFRSETLESIYAADRVAVSPVSAFELIYKLKTGKLPGASRLLAAQALVDDLTIVSIDERFDHYGVRRLW